MSLTQERLKQVLFYDQESGVFTRLQCLQRPDIVNRPASENTSGNGYLRIAIDGKRYYAHRLAWLFVTGSWPDNEIDHVNGIPTDNRWSNLREASSTLNKQNMRRAKSNSKSRVLGVSWDASREKWTARIRVLGSYRYLGRFSTADEAGLAYVAAKREFHEGCTI